MEGLNPVLNLLWSAKKSLEKGESVRSGVKNFVQTETHEWRREVMAWMVKLDQGLPVDDLIQAQKSVYRKQLLKLLGKGLRGEAILPALALLEKETQEKVEMDLESFTARIPYLLLLPLCVCLFPSCLILILGPFILQLMQSF